MPALHFVAFTRNTFISSIDGFVSRVVAKMTEECGEDSVGAAGMLLLCRKNSDTNFARSNGLFLLTEGKCLLATAMLSASNQLSFIWTPKGVRRKGYATTLLCRIGEVWERHTTLLPLWICADQGCVGVPEKAGWIKDGLANKDGTQDYFPPGLRARYVRRRLECLALRQDFGDTMEVFLRLNKNPRTEENNEWVGLMNTWRPYEVRKALTGVRV